MTLSYVNLWWRLVI